MATLGRTSIGINDRAINAVAKGLRLTMTEDASAGISGWAYLSDSATGDTFQMVLVSDTDKQTVLAYSATRTDISTGGWYQFTGGTFDSYAPSNGQTFVVAALSNSAASANIRNDDVGLEGYTGGATVTPGTPPTLGSAMTADTARDYSLYIEYTAAGGSIAPHAMHYARLRAA